MMMAHSPHPAGGCYTEQQKQVGYSAAVPVPAFNEQSRKGHQSLSICRRVLLVMFGGVLAQTQAIHSRLVMFTMYAA